MSIEPKGIPPKYEQVQHLFEEQVRRTPQATALECNGQKITYDALDRRASQLARHLKAHRVSPESVVGVCCERSVHLVTALLGTLKAGGVYLPLDPSYPDERLCFMSQDARIEFLVVQDKFRKKCEFHNGKSLVLDFREDLVEEIETKATNGCDPVNLAYLIYTSGSTGTPKAVGIPHKAAVLHLADIGRTYGYTRQDRVLQSASVGFDVSIEQIMAPLLRGATLVFVEHPFEGRTGFLTNIVRHGITVANIPPAYWTQLAQGGSLGFDEIPSLRLMIVGGDVMPVEGVRHWYRTMPPNIELLNGYGPTETVITSTLFRVRKDFLDGAPTSVPIGQPVTGRHAYILDEAGALCPAGLEGELCFGGPIIARGYLNRPEQTAEKFAPDPFCAALGSRLYRTGDRAKWNELGHIEFIGRNDYQVKLRGFRIELGEIEAVLGRHPKIGECAVVLCERSASDKCLVAYATGSEEGKLSREELRKHVQGKLPDYMVPAHFVLLDRLPVTPNGKIDRRALAAMEPPTDGQERPYVAPRTAVEKRLAEIWASALGRDQIGVEDRFFELGGHSLLATVVTTHIGEEYDIDLPLRAIFEHSTIAELGQFLEKSHFLAKDLPLGPADRSKPLPLSPSQERIWFLEQLNPGLLSYTFQSTLRFEGRLFPSALESALTDIICRHEVLRTTFHEVDGRRVQVIHGPQPVILSIINLHGAADPEGEACKLIEAEIRKPFQCEKLPLIYWLLFRLGPNRHVLLHREHHFVHDGWGFNVFLRELFTLYRRYTGEQLPDLPELPFQFADFAHWQSRWIESDQAELQLNYWKSKLMGAPELLSLPWDHPRPAVPSHQGAAPRVDLPWDLSNLLRQKSREQEVTLFMMMFAVFAVLLRRLSGDCDLCVGCGIANRQWKQTENMLGMIVNNVVLRCDLSGNPTFEQILKQVKETALGAYAHQDLPYDKIVQSLHPRRNLSFPPLIQVMFSFHDSPVPPLDLPGCTVKLHEGISNGSAKWDMNITLIPRIEQAVGSRIKIQNEAITLTWEYNIDLFDAGTIERWIVAYKNLLKTLADDPQQQIDHVALNDREIAEQLIAQSNRRPYAAETETLHELFEKQVEINPEAIAVSYGDRTITYRDLNKRANQLAHYLGKFGIGPESRVGIWVERGIEVVIGILGILKAGAAYVPLDPGYPRERLAYLMRDAALPVLLTEKEMRNVLPESKARVVLLDGHDFSGEEDTNPSPAASFHNIAYVIYTSGSTGAPKGVEVTHGNVIRLFRQTQDEFQLSSDDAWTMFHSYAFDFSVWELWGGLLYGGRVVIVPLWAARSSDEFLGLLLRERVTVLNQTPSAFQQLLRSVEARQHLDQGPSNLRLIIFGGEALDFQPLRRWTERYGIEKPRLINMYGITETTVHVTICPITHDALDERVVGSRIGVPISDLDVYVLDENMQQVIVGMAGEIYVGGAGLARGYLNRPELTAERFLPHPFSTEPGARLYRSGDLARQRADGSLEYLGRIDNQVKIRGYRIELGEIEAMLSEHAKVRESVVVAWEHAQRAEKQLAAFVVPFQNEDLTMEELKEHLKVRLPDYMVPQQFVMLEKLPLTSNGKLDRTSLPDPGTFAIRPQQPFVAPSTPIEESLARIWSDVLQIEPIGIHDNFFNLGGHSLLAMQLLSRIQALYEVKLPLRAIFNEGTITYLAATLEHALLEKIVNMPDKEAQRLLEATELASEVQREG